MRFLGVFIIFFNGFLFIRLLWKRLSLLEKIGLGFWMYSEIFTFVFFILNLYFRVSYTLLNGWIIHLVFAFLFVGLIIIQKVINRKKDFSINLKDKFVLKDLKWWEYFLAFILIVSWLIPLVHGLLFPIPGWDSIVLYDFYGLVFSREGNMLSTLKYSYYGSYPFYIHLSHMWLYLSGFFTPLFWHALLYITFVLIATGWAVRQENGKSFLWIVAIVFTGLKSFYAHSTLGYNNLDTSGFLALSFLYAYEFVRERKVSFLFLSSVLGAGYLWCRNGEPWWVSLVLFYGIFLLLIKEIKWWKKIILFVMAVAILLSTKVVWESSLRNWETLLKKERVEMVVEKEAPVKKEVKLDYKAEVFRILTSVFRPLRYITFDRLKTYLPLTIDMFLRAIVKTRLAYWWLVIFAMILFFSDKSFYKRLELWVWPFFFWVNVVMIFVGTYVFIQTFPDWNIPGSAERMSMFLEPLVIFWVLALIDVFIKSDLGKYFRGSLSSSSY